MDRRFEFSEIKGDEPPLTLCRAVIEGFERRPREVATQFLYDRAGSELFEQITELPEYYPTRTERSILEAHAREIVEAAGDGITLIEFGSGSSVKTRLLIEAALSRQATLRYVPIDISVDFLRDSAAALLESYPRLSVSAMGAEYFDAADALPQAAGPRLTAFLGSNIGNLTRAEAIDFLSRLRRQMRPEDHLLVGIDLIKERPILEAAYNDRQGITAEFNKNVLRRINRELDGNFDLACWRHFAPYDEREARIEMRLVSLGDQRVTIEAIGRTYEFHDGEYLHTEWSHKYTRESFGELCREAGLEAAQIWTDSRNWFGLALLRVGG